MGYAIVSDIHANQEALTAVMEDIDDQNVERILCLGDVIGYGPDPRETLDVAIKRFEFSLKGNHEHAILFQPIGFNESATKSANWTKEQINDTSFDREENHRLWNFLGELKDSKTKEDILYVHASPVDPVNQYVLPGDIHNRQKMDEIFSHIEGVCFGGHTHIPGVFEEGKGQFLSPEELDHSYDLNENRALINVGSVGQPRDGNTDACYVIIEDEEVHYRRVAYDVQKTAERIKNADGLPDVLGQRLLAGR